MPTQTACCSPLTFIVTDHLSLEVALSDLETQFIEGAYKLIQSLSFGRIDLDYFMLSQHSLFLL